MTDLRILVTVGSDHHPFDRLIGWVDEWLAQATCHGLTAVVQHGTAAAPRHATRSVDYLPHDELQGLLRSADVVVTQGGPMGIVEARRCGTTPIAVPRLARLGEVVDDHQVAFCRQLAAAGRVVLAEDSTAVHAALERALAEPGVYRTVADSEADAVAHTVARFAALVDGLPARRRLTPSARWGVGRRARARSTAS